MILCDVNIYVYAHREDYKDHDRFRRWLEDQLSSDASYGISELVFSSFVRIVTHPKIFKTPSPLEDAFAFVNQIRSRSNAVLVQPGPRHWEIFVALCNQVNAKGNLIPDAYLGALAIESGCEWITTDRDYSRFKKLEWRHPFE